MVIRYASYFQKDEYEGKLYLKNVFKYLTSFECQPCCPLDSIGRDSETIQQLFFLVPIFEFQDNASINALKRFPKVVVKGIFNQPLAYSRTHKCVYRH